MRSYDIAAVALAIGVNLRWVDNAVTHSRLPGVQRAARGRSRRFSPASVLQLAVAHRLWVSFSVPVAPAVELAHLLIETGTVERNGLRLILNVGALKGEVERALAAAVESSLAPRRGRPPGKR